MSFPRCRIGRVSRSIERSEKCYSNPGEDC